MPATGPVTVSMGEWTEWEYNQCVGRVIGLSLIGLVIVISGAASMAMEGHGNYCYPKGRPGFGL